MASVRTQKEIRQRAPIWLVTLLVANLVIMAVDARDADGELIGTEGLLALVRRLDMSEAAADASTSTAMNIPPWLPSLIPGRPSCP